MESFGPAVVRKSIAAPLAEVWSRLVSANADEGVFAFTLDAEVGGSVSAPATDAFAAREGTVDVLTDGLTVGWRWRAADVEDETTVLLMLRPDDADLNDTRITVIESGFAALDDAPSRVAAAESEWTSAFDALGVLLVGEAPEEEVAGEEPVADEEPAADEEAVADDESAPAMDAAEAEDADEVDETETEDGAESEDPEQAEDATSAETIAESDDDDDDDDDDDGGAGGDADNETDNDDDDDDVPEEGDTYIAAVVADDGDDDDDIVEAEVIIDEVYVETEGIESGDGVILLPEVGQKLSGQDTTLTATGGLGIDTPIEVEEISEWERLLHGEDIDDD